MWRPTKVSLLNISSYHSPIPQWLQPSEKRFACMKACIHYINSHFRDMVYAASKANNADFKKEQNNIIPRLIHCWKIRTVHLMSIFASSHVRKGFIKKDFSHRYFMVFFDSDNEISLTCPLSISKIPFYPVVLLEILTLFWWNIEFLITWLCWVTNFFDLWQSSSYRTFY